MSFSKLYIFSKETDATATEQGFHYQKLKTLKLWLENRVNEIDDSIYCDYEDDIFERNIEENKVTFRQVKLYSDNFSFSREEIQKSLAHFFMLLAKSDYLLDDVTFFFETNSGTAREYKGNDGKLLKEWAENQDEISDDLLERCKIRVKAIIDTYINEVYNSRTEGNISPEFEQQLKSAKSIYESLPDELWDNFIRSIKWQFDAIEKIDAIPLLLADIERLILLLPLPLDPNKVSTYLPILHYEIATRTAQQNIAERTLSNDLLDIILLNKDTDDNKWYAETYEKWLQAPLVTEFNIGDFYEVVYAARHCRFELYKTNHSDLWLNLLSEYGKLTDILVFCRRKSIYEFLFLVLSPDPETGQPKGTIIENEDAIKYYFQEFDNRHSIDTIGEDTILLQFAQMYHKINPNFLDNSLIQIWSQKIEEYLNNKIEQATSADELCKLYELKGNFIFHTDFSIPFSQKLKAALKFYRLIIPKLDKTSLYSISKLFDELNKILEIFILETKDEESIHLLEEFIEELEDFAGENENKFKKAFSLVKRAHSYLKGDDTTINIHKALDCFHRAKEILYTDATKDIFILSLISISNLYFTLGMNLAAKYYGLCASWASFHFGDPTLLKRVSSSYACVFSADFAQGAWINSLSDLSKYIIATLEYLPKHLSFEADTEYRHVVSDFACIVVTTPIISPELSVLIDYNERSLGRFFIDDLEMMKGLIAEKFKDKTFMEETLKSKLTGAILNDIGHVRIISFNCLGIEWIIRFENTASCNAIAEEFCALLQVILCEVWLLGVDMYFLSIPVTINITKADAYVFKPFQLQDSNKYECEFSIPALHTNDINRHYSHLGTIINLLLRDLSLLKKGDFDEIFDVLYKQQNIGKKGLSLQSYQKTFFNLLSVDEFNSYRRADFTPLDINYLYNSPKDILPVNLTFNRYDKSKALAIINESYLNSTKSLSITLDKWRSEADFRYFIYEVRQDGWLDWQILVAIKKTVINYKAKLYTNDLPPLSLEIIDKAFETEFWRIYDLTEEECYSEIPLSI